MDEVVDRPTEAQHGLPVVDELGGRVAEHVHAEQTAVIASEHELHEPIGVARDECTTAVVERRDPDLVVEALGLRLLFGDPDGSRLGDGVHAHRRDRVDHLFEVDAERVTCRDAPLLHRDRRERGWADHVAGGVDARRARAVALVDRDVTVVVDVNTRVGETKLLGVAHPPGREQHLVGAG